MSNLDANVKRQSVAKGAVTLLRLEGDGIDILTHRFYIYGEWLLECDTATPNVMVYLTCNGKVLQDRFNNLVRSKWFNSANGDEYVEVFALHHEDYAVHVDAWLIGTQATKPQGAKK